MTEHPTPPHEAEALAPDPLKPSTWPEGEPTKPGIYYVVWPRWDSVSIAALEREDLGLAPLRGIYSLYGTPAPRHDKIRHFPIPLTPSALASPPAWITVDPKDERTWPGQKHMNTMLLVEQEMFEPYCCKGWLIREQCSDKAGARVLRWMKWPSARGLEGR